jgi:molybdopterin molybdotransferase
MTMISVAEAQQRILSSFSPTDSISIPLDWSTGHVLAQDIHAPVDLPLFDNSAMDGFAVLAQDTCLASPEHPVILSVVADIPAGDGARVNITHGTAARIMTGALIPGGADSVVMIEETDYGSSQPGDPIPGRVAIHKPVEPGTNIRKKGDDIHSGQIAIKKGSQLRPQDLGLLAMFGMATIPIHRSPRLAIFSSGDELISLETPLSLGSIRDANTYTLSSLAELAGAEVIRLGIAKDDRVAIIRLLDQAVDKNVDMIVSSAGISVGAFDFIRDVVNQHGNLDFWRVNVRPGKPFAFGNYRNIPFFGLPGNPVSAFVTFELFIRPVLKKMGGSDDILRPRIRVRLLEDIVSDGRESYLRANVEERDGVLFARLTGHQGSGNILSLVQANALLILPSGVKSLPAGTNLEAMLLQ